MYNDFYGEYDYDAEITELIENVYYDEGSFESMDFEQGELRWSWDPYKKLDLEKESSAPRVLVEERKSPGEG